MTTFDLRDKKNITIIHGTPPESFYPGKVFCAPADEMPGDFNCQEQCGKCCQHFYIGLRKEDAADEAFRLALTMRGITVVSLFGGMAIIKAPCQNLIFVEQDGKRKGRCAIYKTRPLHCRTYNCANDPVMQILKAVEKNPDMLK